MATSDFKVKKGLQVGPGDFSIDVDNDTASFANGYTISIGAATVLTDADNISNLSNDANYITLNDLSVGGDLSYDNATGEFSFTERTDAEVRGLISGTGDISYDNTTGEISLNNTTGFITLTNLSGGTGVTYDNATGEISIGQAVATTDDVTFANITATKLITNTIEAQTGTEVTIDDSLIVSGDLTVNGTTTTLNTATLDVEDLNITVASGATDATAANTAGLTVDLGTDGTATISYASLTDRFVVNKTVEATLVGNVTGDLTGTADDADALSSAVTVELTGDVTGSATFTNAGDTASITTTVANDSVTLGTQTTGQYASTISVSGTGLSATEANADDATAYTITSNATDANTASTIVARDASGNFTAGTITANLTGDVTGTVSDVSNHSTDDISEPAGATVADNNVYYTEARFDASLGNKTTVNITEDPNGTTTSGTLYFTESRARNTISVDGSLTYDSATGVLSYTERTDAEIRGLFSAGGDITYNNTTGEFAVTLPDDLGDLTNNAGYIKLADLSATGSLSYNNTTGEFSFTERTDAEIKGLFSAGGDLVYDNATGEFSITKYTDTEADARIAAASIGDLLDVDITGVGNVIADGEVLVYDANNSKFVPSAFYNTTNFETDLSNSSTNNLSEGTDNSVGETSPGAGDGTNNLYFTTTRAREAISVDVASALTYNSTTGVLGADVPENVSDLTNDSGFIALTDLSATGSLSYNDSTGTFSYTERTDAEIKGLFSATGSISYNNTTGVISFTERTDGEVRGLLSGTGDITYNNTTGVISFNNTSGFITAAEIGEVDTLDSVTTRGSTTENSIEVGGITVNGDMTVTGTTTYINTTTLNIGDNIITLNADVPGDTAPSQNAGLQINRGNAFDVFIRYNETNDKWEFTNNGTDFNNIATATSDLTNDSNFAALTDFSGGTDIDFNNATGEISFSNDTGYITLTDISGTGDITYNNTTGEISFNNNSGFITSFSETDTLDSVTGRGNTTTNTAEFGGLTVGGTNVALAGEDVSGFNNDANYIALTALSGTGDITYNNTTGEISFNNNSGFITAESDTLASVTGRGATTNSAVSINNTLTVDQEILSSGVVLQTEAGANKTQVELQNGYIKFDYINQAYVNGDIWLGASQQNTVGGDTRKIATANALGTDIPGNTLQLDAGAGSGNASSGNITFRTGSQGQTSGSVVSTLVERFRINGTDGAVVFNNAYKFPTVDGTNNEYLKTNGSGEVSFNQIDYTELSNTPALSDVALSGDYGDLINVPTNISTFINDAGYITERDDLVGSVFADDSTLLVDGVSGRLMTSRLSQDGASSGQALVWDGTAWVPGTVSGNNITVNLDNLGDVDTTGKSTGDFLQWDGVSGRWVAADPGEATGISASQAEEISFVSALILG